MKQASRILCSLFLVVCMTAGFLLPVAGASSAGQITVRDEVEVINSVRIGFDTAVISPGQTAAFPDAVRVSTAGFVPTESETSIRYYQFPTSMSAMNPKAGYGKHNIGPVGGESSAYVVSYDPADPDYTDGADQWGESDLSVYPAAFLTSDGNSTFDYATFSFRLYLEGIVSNVVLRLESTPKYRLMLIHPVYEDENGNRLAEPYAEVYLRTLNTNAQDTTIESDVLIDKVKLAAWNTFKLSFWLQSGTLGFYDYSIAVNGEEKTAAGHMEYFSSLETTANTSLVGSTTQLHLCLSRPEERPSSEVTWAVDDLTFETMRYTGEPDEISAALASLTAEEKQEFRAVWKSTDYSAAGIVNVRPQGVRINGSSAVFYDRYVTGNYVRSAGASDLFAYENNDFLTITAAPGADGLLIDGKTYAPVEGETGTYKAADSHYIFRLAGDRLTVSSDISASDPFYQVKGTYEKEGDVRTVRLNPDSSVTLGGMRYAVIPLYKQNGNAYLTGNTVSDRFRVSFNVNGHGITGVSVGGVTLTMDNGFTSEVNRVIVEVDGSHITAYVNGVKLYEAENVERGGDKPLFLIRLTDNATLGNLSLEEYVTTTVWRDEAGREVDAARAAYIRYCQAKTKHSENYRILVTDTTLSLDGAEFLPADAYASSMAADGSSVTLCGVTYTRDAGNASLYKAGDGTTLVFDRDNHKLTRTYAGGVEAVYTYAWSEDSTTLVLSSDGSSVSLSENSVGLTVAGQFYQNAAVNVFALYDDRIKVNGTVYNSYVPTYSFALSDTEITMDGVTYRASNTYIFSYVYNADDPAKSYIKIGDAVYDPVSAPADPKKPIGEFRNNSIGATIAFSEDGTLVWNRRNPNPTGKDDAIVSYGYTYEINSAGNRLTMVPRGAVVPQDNYRASNGNTLNFAIGGTVQWKKSGIPAINYRYDLSGGNISLSLTGVRKPIGIYTATNGDFYTFPEKTTDTTVTFTSGAKVVKYRYSLNSQLSRLTLIDLSDKATGTPKTLSPDGTYLTADGKMQVVFDRAAGTVTFTSGGVAYTHRYTLTLDGEGSSDGKLTLLSLHESREGQAPEGAYITADASAAVVFDGADFAWHNAGKTREYTATVNEDLTLMTLLPKSMFFEEKDGRLTIKNTVYTRTDDTQPDRYELEKDGTLTVLTFDRKAFKLTWRETYADGKIALWVFRYEINAAKNRISLTPKAADFDTGDRRAVRPVGDVQFDSSTYYPGGTVRVNTWGTTVNNATVTDVTYWGTDKSGIGSTATDDDGKEYIVTEENNPYLLGEVFYEIESDGAFVTRLATGAKDWSATFQANLKRTDGVKNMREERVTEYFRYSFSIWYDTETFPDDGFYLYFTAPNAKDADGQKRDNFSGQILLGVSNIDGVPYLVLPQNRFGRLYDDEGNSTLDLNAPSPDGLVKGKTGEALKEVLRDKVINNYRSTAKGGTLPCTVDGKDYNGTRGMNDQIIPLAYQALDGAVTFELEEGWNTIEMEFSYLGERTSNDLRKADEGTIDIPTVNGLEGEESSYKYAVVNGVTHAYFKVNIKANGEYVTYNDNPDDTHNADFIFDNGMNPCKENTYMQGAAKLHSNGTETETQQERLKLKDFKLEFLTDGEIDVNCYEKGTDGSEIIRCSAFDGKTTDPLTRADGDIAFVSRNQTLVVSHNSDNSTAEICYALTELVDDRFAFDLSLYADYVDYSGNVTVAERDRRKAPASFAIFFGDRIVCSVDEKGNVANETGDVVSTLKVRGWNDISVVAEKFGRIWYLTLYVQGEIVTFRAESSVKAADFTTVGIRSVGDAGTSFLLDNMAAGLDNIPSSLIYMHPVTYITGDGEMAYDGGCEDYHVIGRETTTLPEVASEEAVFDRWYFDEAFTAKANRVKASRTAPVVLYARYNYRVSYVTDGIVTVDPNGNTKPIKTPVPSTTYGIITLPNRTNVSYWYALKAGDPSAAVYRRCGETYNVVGNITFIAADSRLEPVIDFILSVRELEALLVPDANGRVTNYVDLEAAMEKTTAALARLLPDGDTLEGALLRLANETNADTWASMLLEECTEEVRQAIRKAAIVYELKYAKGTLLAARGVIDGKLADAEAYLAEFTNGLANSGRTYAERMASYEKLNALLDENGKTWRNRVDPTCPGVTDANEEIPTYKTTLDRARNAAVSLIEAYETYLGGTYTTRKERFEATKALLSAYDYCRKKADTALVLTYVPTADDFLTGGTDADGNPLYSIDITHLIDEGEGTMAVYFARVSAIFEEYNAAAEAVSADMVAATTAGTVPTNTLYKTVFGDATPAIVPMAIPAGIDDLRRRLHALFHPEENA